MYCESLLRMSDAQGVELIAGYAGDNVPSEPGHSKAKRLVEFIHISSLAIANLHRSPMNA